MIRIYRVITENGYAEFRTMQAAQDYADENNAIEIQEDTKEIE